MSKKYNLSDFQLRHLAIICYREQGSNENPEERKRLGWIKHITYDRPEDTGVEYDPQTQYYVITQKQIDEYTVEDVFRIKDKSEEQLLFEEMLEVAQGGSFSGGSIIFTGGDFVL